MYIRMFFFLSGISCGIYLTNNADACKYIAEDCKMSIVVVDDETQLQKILEVTIYFSVWSPTSYPTHVDP